MILYDSDLIYSSCSPHDEVGVYMNVRANCKVSAECILMYYDVFVETDNQIWLLGVKSAENSVFTCLWLVNMKA